MANQYVQVGNIGTIIELEVTRESDGSVVNTNLATTIEVTLKNDTGTSTTFTGTNSGDGTDGKIRYTTTAASDIDEEGNWEAQGHVAFADGTDYKTRPRQFKALANL